MTARIFHPDEKYRLSFNAIPLIKNSIKKIALHDNSIISGTSFPVSLFSSRLLKSYKK
jgi:hypothetical protein